MNTSVTLEEVDALISQSGKWSALQNQLRIVLLESGFQETVKWKQLCYTYKGKNSILLSHLKEYCTLSFIQGALFLDPYKVLVDPGPNSRHSKYMRFQNLEDLKLQEEALLFYLNQAKECIDQGKTIDRASIKPEDIPIDLTQMLKASKSFHDAFFNLTPGRQRGYCIYFSGAKQSTTRIARIEKMKSRILDGKGLHDR